jgi:hypothetical protein
MVNNKEVRLQLALSWASPAPLQTAASAKAADAHLGDPRAIRGAESNASVEVTACQAQAKGASAVSARICRSHQPGRRDHTLTAITATAFITRKMSIGT